MNQLVGTIETVNIQPAEIKEPHPMAEFWYFFKQNTGAVIGLSIVMIFLVMAIVAPWLSPFDPAEIQDGALRLGPAWTADGHLPYLLGTDDVGRDQLSRLLYGARISLGVGFVVVFISLTAGTFLGLMAGYFGGWVDHIVMRSVDILMSLPSILLAIVVVSILGPSLLNAIIAVSVVAMPGFVRLTRASMMSEKVKNYVVASRTFGAHPARLIFREI